MFVNGIGTANPPHRYSKAACWEAFKTSAWFRKLDRRAHMIAETVLKKDNGIETRSLAVDSLDEVFNIDPDTLHSRFLANAPGLMPPRAALTKPGSTLPPSMASSSAPAPATSARA
jgi:alkylresorcinol/alkylpyrone synthase